MKKCRVKNYDAKLYSNLIDFSKLTSSNVDELISDVYEVLKGLPFSTNIDDSIDSDSYVDSINSLVKDVLSILSNTPLPFKLNASDKIRISRSLKGELLPPPLTKAEEQISAIIKGTDLVRSEDILKIRYKQILSDIYDDSTSGMDSWRLLNFLKDMMLATIIDTSGEGTIIDSDEKLNQGIIDYLESLYKIIRDYLSKYCFKNIESALFPLHLYTLSKNKDIKVKTYNNSNTLDAMYNVIKSLQNENTFSNSIKNGWNDDILNIKEITLDRELYAAVNAFINLKYFDDILKYSFSNFIDITNQYNPILSIEDLYGTPTYLYKYKIRTGNSNARKTWGDTEADSLEEMAKFNLVLINNIPTYDYKDKTKKFGNLETKDFIGTIAKLKTIGTFSTDAEFRNAIEELTTSNSREKGHLQTIFQKLFVDLDKSIIKELLRFGFDDNNMNTLYSIYRTVFYLGTSRNRSSKSWLEIEKNYLQTKGIKSRYNLVEAIYNMFCSNVELNYLETVYDSDLDKYVTRIKEKYSISKNKFDIINDINDSIIDRTDKAELLDSYKFLKLDGGKNYSVEISGLKYNINIDNNTLSILTKKNVKSKQFIIPELKALKDVDLSTSQKRINLVNLTKLSSNEQLFMDVLSFIDDMLNTSFSKNAQSLNEFYLSSLGNKSFLHDLFMSASRALAICDIYNNFTNTSVDGKHYSRTLLRLYMKDAGGYIGIFDAKRYNDFFKKRYDGFLLTAIDSNEPWVIKLANIRALLAKDTSKSVISNLEGNKQPNYSPAFLSGEIKSQLKRANDSVDTAAHLLFSNNRTAIRNVTVNNDIKTKEGKVKLIKSATEVELLYDAIVNKFLIPLLDSKTAFVLATTQSDKTKFISTQVDFTDITVNNIKLIDLLKYQSVEDTIISGILNTIGNAYNSLYKNVINDYKKLFPSVQTIADINNIFKGNPVKIDTGKEFTINSVEDLMDAVAAYNKAHPAEHITLYKDLHYRELKGTYVSKTELNSDGIRKILSKKRLAFNELLYEYANNLYNLKDSSQLRNRLNIEKRNFLNALLLKQFSIPATDLIKSIIRNVFDIDPKLWITKVGKDEYVVLAKLGGQNILIDNLDNNADFELNPILNAYFYIDDFLGNNLRFSTTGSEINHNIKELSKIDLKDKIKELEINNENLHILKPDYDEDIIDFLDIQNMINRGKELISKGINTSPETLENTINQLQNIYDSNLYKLENLGLGAQFKRNVIMTATMNKIIPSLEGIGENLKIACIEDVPANVFNFSGKTDVIDAHDGSALLSPFLSRLENKSLGPNEVGEVKKPIHHAYNNKYMTATLLKYATDTITNRWMRQSVGNDANNDGHAINLYNVFYKMHNMRWHNADGSWKYGKVDLIEGCGFRKDKSISFSKDILERDNMPNNNLYYNKNGKHIKIIGLGLENGIYYTKELEVMSDNKPKGDVKKVYHYFDDSGEHFPSDKILTDTKNHTIDSLYELHKALGGIWSESYIDGNFTYSEASIAAVTNYINLVANLKEGADPDDISIASYSLPLKNAMIHVITNNSAIKNGAGNMNPVSSWYDNKELAYMNIDTLMYGIQLDSDHTADEAHMTEFSLVISSLDAGGYLHDYISLIYLLLGQTALDMSKVEIDAVKLFTDTGNISAIYDVIGRTIMANIKSGKNEIGLAGSIINNIKKKFNLNIDHNLDQLKIPFSDPNIYSQILSTFVSNINKKSIKRLYPGLGTVMVPSYNMSMIYDINGETYQFEDLIKEAREKGFTSTEKDNTKINLDVVKLYLQSLQENESYKQVDEFIPTENVLVTILSKNGAINQVHISLNKPKDYYNFEEDPAGYLEKKGYKNIISLKYLKDLTIPRNLAPLRITWDYKDSDGNIHHTNIFNHWRVKGLIKEFAYINDLKVSKTEKRRLLKEASKRWNVDLAFKDLKRGVYQLEQNGPEVLILNLKNDAAEIIMSNIYASRFNIKEGDSLVDVLKKGPDYFKLPEVNLDSENYDLIFTKGSGKHTFITLKPLLKNTENVSTYYKEWDNINKVPFKSNAVLLPNSPKVLNKVYATTKDNIRLFEIGREIVRDDIVWDNKNKIFIKDGKKVANLNNYRRNGDLVIEYIEFVTLHTVNEATLDGAYTTYNLYNINRDAIKRCMELIEYSKDKLTYTNSKGKVKALSANQKFELEVNKFISNILADIYKSEDYGEIQLNKTVSSMSCRILQNTLYNLSQELNYDNSLSKSIQNLYNTVASVDLSKVTDNKVTFNKVALRKIHKEYLKENKNKIYTSFLKSLYFTAARIPAQTLQSFMKMKNVGFSGTKTGQCYVTAWLTWLLGSKINNN